MSGEFHFNSAGQVHELEMALAKSGDWNNSDVTAVIQRPELLSGFLNVVRGQAQIVTVRKHVVTCACGGFLSRLGSNWSEEEHKSRGTMELEKRADGQLYINGRKVERHLSPNQKNDNVVNGNKLREELESDPVLCACVLGYLLQYTEFIPEDWKAGSTFFWGTIFRYRRGNLNVACLDWGGDQWDWNCYWLEYGWSSDDPAARLASE